MLPSFTVPIHLGGETHAHLVQDVPACVFWQGYPDTADAETSDRDKRQAEAAWLRHLLVRVTVQPELTLEWVQEMGEDSWPPTQAYLEAIGFSPSPVLAPVAAVTLLQIETKQRGRVSERRRDAEFAAFRGCVPPPHIRRLFRLVARVVSVPAAQLWLMPASEFFFNYHVHLTDEERAAMPLPQVKP